jgi:hypothetical protein
MTPLSSYHYCITVLVNYLDMLTSHNWFRVKGGGGSEICSLRAPFFLTLALLATYCLHCHGSKTIPLLLSLKHILSMITT